MALYRLTNRKFSREWRRSKNYREHEITWLAKKRGLQTRSRNRTLEVFDPKTKRVVANFVEVREAEAKPVNERNQLFVALKG